MDANVRASDYRSTVISFESSTFQFVVGNIASLAIIVFGDLTSQAQLALAAFVVINNLAGAVSFDSAIGGFSVLAKDLQNENSNMGKEAGKHRLGFTEYSVLLLVLWRLLPSCLRYTLRRNLKMLGLFIGSRAYCTKRTREIEALAISPAYRATLL